MKSSANNRAGRKRNNQNMAGTKTPDGSRRDPVSRGGRTIPVAADRKPPQRAHPRGSQNASGRCRCTPEVDSEKVRPEKNENRGSPRATVASREHGTNCRALRTTARARRFRSEYGAQLRRSVLRPSAGWKCALLDARRSEKRRMECHATGETTERPLSLHHSAGSRRALGW